MGRRGEVGSLGQSPIGGSFLHFIAIRSLGNGWQSPVSPPVSGTSHPDALSPVKEDGKVTYESLLFHVQDQENRGGPL
jgi:hypothetical protein